MHLHEFLCRIKILWLTDFLRSFCSSCTRTFSTSTRPAILAQVNCGRDQGPSAAKDILANPARKCLSNDLVRNVLIRIRNIPRLSIGAQAAAKIECIVEIIGGPINEIRKKLTGAAMNSVAQNIIVRWTSWRCLYLRPIAANVPNPRTFVSMELKNRRAPQMCLYSSEF